MYGELYQYLILHKQVALPGIGTVQLERAPADIDFVNKMANPPRYSISLHHGQVNSSTHIYHWLSSSLGISEQDAITQLSSLAATLKEKVLTGEKVEWSGVGTFSKGMAGEIRFDTAVKDLAAGQPVPALKVIREHAEHSVLVGEQEKTSSEMTGMLTPPVQRRFPWWGIALTAVLLAIVFIVIYFSSKGVTVASTGNQQKVVPQQAAPTHQQVP
jgi:hypothetical protein